MRDLTKRRASSRVWHKADRIKRAERGQCSRCSADAAPKRSMCKRHLQEDCARSKKRYRAEQKRIARVLQALVLGIGLGFPPERWARR